MPEIMRVRVYGVPRHEGGTCEKCGKNRAVVYVADLDAFQCSTCLMGNLPSLDKILTGEGIKRGG